MTNGERCIRGARFLLAAAGVCDGLKSADAGSVLALRLWIEENADAETLTDVTQACELALLLSPTLAVVANSAIRGARGPN